MRKKIFIEEVKKGDNKLLLIPKAHSFQLEKAKAKNYMLADSDELAFIYILEIEEEFIYVSIPSSLWEELKEAIDQNVPMFLFDGPVMLELSGMIEELSYLIENIDGNANYGEEMEKAVRQAFLL